MLLRRTHITALWQAALLVVLTFASCASDDLSDFGDNAGLTDTLLPDDGARYMALKVRASLGTAATTRAAVSGEFEDGSAKEQAVSTSGNFVILFDENKTLMAMSLLSLSAYSGVDKQGNIEATYLTKFYPVDDVMPKYCLVVLNGTALYEKMTATYTPGTTTCDQILGAIWEGNPEELGVDKDLLTNTTFYTMTNSVYYDDNKELQVPVEIPELVIATTPEEAEQNSMSVYVERMVSKFTLTFSGSDKDHIFTPGKTIRYCTFEQDGTPKYKDLPFRIRVTGWNINALETKTYVFKKIGALNAYDFFPNWNDSKNYRSYWAEDVNYDNPSYPWQYGKAINKNLTFYKQAYNTTENNNILKNYSYNALNDSKFDKEVYTPENTYNPAAVSGKHDDRDPLLAGTHLIICADLEISFDNGNTFKAPEHLYRDRKGVYYSTAKDCFWGLVREFNNDLQSQYLLRFDYYDWGEDAEGTDARTSKYALTIEGEYEVYNGTAAKWQAAIDAKDAGTVADWPVTVSKVGGAYALYHEDSEGTYQEVTYQYVSELSGELFEDAIIKGGDGKILPWLEGLRIKFDGESNNDESWLQLYEEAEIRYSYDSANGKGGKRVVVGENPVPAEPDDRKSLMFEWMGAVDYFKDGKMYYAAPAELHLSGESKMGKTGIYGAVRNGWYKYDLKDIKAVGTSVYKFDEPIVPNTIVTKDQMNITVDILNWHSFDITVPVL